MLPVLNPVAPGVKLTLMLQLAPAATVPLLGHVVAEVRAKSPLTVTLEMFSVAVPLFDSVTLWALLVVPTSWFANVRLIGASVTAACSPVPVRVIVWGLPGASSVMPTMAVRVPPPVGAKVAVT
jgi:hypothetical protein